MAEIATAVAVEAAAEAAKPLLARVCRQCGYVMFTDRYVGQLEDGLQRLNNARQRVQHSVDWAGHQMKPTEADVENWVKKAETVAQKAGDVLAHKARDVLDDEGRAKKTCFCEWLPNPKGRYCLGRDARKTAEAIQELIPQGRFEKVYYENAPPALVERAAEVNSSACVGGDTIQELNARGQFEKVDFENPPTVLVSGASGVNSSAGEGGDFITGSRASIFQDMMKALDDENLKVIGVYGPGGVGKTTLLEEVEKKLREAGRPFHMIVKVEVSKSPDLNNIVDQIADDLGLELTDKRSRQGKAKVLSKRLKSDLNEKVLIIFDNLWEKLDLEAVGIPRKDVSSKCKLLLTSRFEDVLEKEMDADRTFHLQGLTDGEASMLFENKVGDKLKNDEELKSIADQVVNKLAGLPLLIISVATTLKSSDKSAWRNALIQIDDSNKEKKETIVRLSYEHLKSEGAKYLFVLCGLIGGTIRVELLFVLAMGLGLFERFNKTIQDSRDRLNSMLNELRSACLLLDGGNDKGNVTIHDLYSEVVVSYAFSGQDSLVINDNYDSWPKEKLKNCWACLVNVGSDRLAELMLHQFPHVKILMLSEQNDMGDCSRMDFTYMEELRALYLCSMRVTSLPSSMEILGNLQSLSIDCHVEDVANLGKLKALRILSFAMSTISRLPKEIGKLTNLRSLNLSHCYSLEIIEPGALKGLINLEELHMKRSFDRWMGKNERPSELCNVGLAELRDMTKLNSLEISIRDPIILLEVDDLPFENLTRSWINIGNAEGREFEGLRTMKIKFEGHDGILLNKWVQKTLQKTQYLLLDGLSMTVLESLFLNNLINLEKICHGHSHGHSHDHGQIATECLSKLKAVRAEECKVRKCDSMRAIARKDIVLADYKVELPDLRHLDLARLPKMTSFCTRVEMTSEGTPIQAGTMDEGGGDEGIELVTTTSDLQDTYSDSFFNRKVSLPNLEDLKFDSVGSFKRIWHDELSKSSFGKLATITVENCSDLLHIFPSTIIGRLHNLKNVNIKRCPSLKSLFDCGSLDSNMEQATVLLPELVRINVESCPSLEWLFNCGSLDSNAKHKIVLLPKLGKVRVSGAKRLRYVVMSHSQVVLGFPSLEIVSVENCSDLRYLFPSYTATTLVKLERLEITKCEQMKEVILDKEVGRSEVEVMSFPRLSTLILEELYNLISFGSGSCSYYFSSLKDLRIVGCCNFEAFIPSPTSVKRQLEENDESPQSLFNKIVGCCNFGAFIPSPTGVKRQLGKTVEENDESLQPLFNEMVTLPNIRSLNIEGVLCKELGNNHVPANSFSKLRTLVLKNCDNLQRIAPSYMWKMLQHSLRILEVISCRSIKIIYEGDGKDTECCELWQVVLRDLGNLRCIWQSDDVPNVPFSNLSVVEVVRCSRLEMLFPTFTVKFLERIKGLVVESCENMELIAGDEKGVKRMGREERTGTKVTFSNLRTLRLFELPKLSRFLSEKYSLEYPHSDYFPSLIFRSVARCGLQDDRGIFEWEVCKIILSHLPYSEYYS